jgi:solute:Na+ symporter, SSS family
LTAQLILICFLVYTALLFLVSSIASRKSNNESFFIGNRVSPWYVVAYGMIGASLSGVTFISIPGDVYNNEFSYLMIVLGYVIGYIVIAKILLPIYYSLRLTSIYTYLDNRFGNNSYLTGASFFLLSRIIGASFRMYLVVNVLQIFVFDYWNIPFAVSVSIFILLILSYTFKGGIKTIVWTDTLQTTFMLAAVVLSIYLVSDSVGLGLKDMYQQMQAQNISRSLIFDWQDSRFFLKQIISGMFITIAMTGLDQDMMQKNLSCRNLKDAQKNVISLGFVLVPINVIFMFLGGALILYAQQHGIDINAEKTDDLFPVIAIQYIGPVSGIIFFIGLIAAAYSSADSALTSLTTSFSIDILKLDKRNITEKKKTEIRYIVHIFTALVLLAVIVLFRVINDDAVINKLFTFAGYTYGPLLGLFSFGLFLKREVKDKWIPIVAIISPIISFIISYNSERLLYGYKFGFELLLLNALLCFLGIYILSYKRKD